MTARRLPVLLAALLTALLAASCSAGPPPGPLPPPSRYAPSPTPTPDDRPPGPTLYVAPDGDDAASGAEGDPRRTIAAASRDAAPGTTVLVADGRYDGDFTTTRSGTAELPVVYRAENPGRALLTSSDTSADSVWRNYGDHVVIRGFDVTGRTGNGLITSGSDTRYLDNRVHDVAGGSCIASYRQDYGLQDMVVVGNVVSGCGTTKLDHGIYVGQPGGVVSNNIVFGNAGYGIHCWHNCTDVTISNNLVFDNATGGILVGQGDSPNYGDVPADHMTVSNNIVVDNGGPAIRESGATGRGNRYLANLVHGNRVDRPDLETGSEDGTVTGDPLFAGFEPDGSGDYHLADGSPGIDAGTETGAPDRDAADTPRPQGRGVDIGVYER